MQSFLKSRNKPTPPPLVDADIRKDFRRAAPYAVLAVIAGISYVAFNWGPPARKAEPIYSTFASQPIQQSTGSQQTEFSSFDACFVAAKSVVDATKSPGRRVVEPLFQPGQYYSAIIYTDDGKRVVIGCDGRIMRAKEEPVSQ